MSLFNYFPFILGIIFCQVCMVYSSCFDISEVKGSISDTYTARGASLYHKCWTLKNPGENTLYIQLQNISLHNRPASSGALTIKFLSEFKMYNISSQSELRNLTTTSSVVEIHFKVNSAHFANGMITSFALYFRQDCNRVLLEPTGILNNPNYPGKSPNEAECIYEIILRPGYLINITFYNVRISYDENCDDKYIKVHDGDSQESPLIAQLCGRIVSYPIISTKNYMWIHFKAHIFGSIFYANYTAIQVEHDDCNPKDSFRCSNNTCVPKINICDGIKNCENGADELGCVYNNCNDKNSFRCSDNTCISMNDVCNGINNCQNGADEIGCVKMPTKTHIEHVGEIVTNDSRKNFQSSFTEENVESGVQKLSPRTTETKDLTSKDVLKMEVKEHQYRIEVLELQKEILELQKRYESDRLEYQKSFETEKLKKMRQLHDAKARVIEKGFDKNHFEE